MFASTLSPSKSASTGTPSVLAPLRGLEPRRARLTAGLRHATHRRVRTRAMCADGDGLGKCWADRWGLGAGGSSLLLGDNVGFVARG